MLIASPLPTTRAATAMCQSSTRSRKISPGERSARYRRNDLGDRQQNPLIDAIRSLHR